MAAQPLGSGSEALHSFLWAQAGLVFFIVVLVLLLCQLLLFWDGRSPLREACQRRHRIYRRLHLVVVGLRAGRPRVLRKSPSLILDFILLPLFLHLVVCFIIWHDNKRHSCTVFHYWLLIKTYIYDDVLLALYIYRSAKECTFSCISSSLIAAADFAVRPHVDPRST